MNTNSIILKVFALGIIDIITLFLFLSVWVIINIPVFPWALIFVLLSALILNIVVLSSKKIKENYGTSIFIIAVFSSVLYYIFIIAFTGFSYAVISPKWYIIISLIATLVLIGINSGFAITKANNYYEKDAMHNVKIIMMNTESALLDKKNLMNIDSFKLLKSSVDKAFERIDSCSPFGRYSYTAVLELENQIIQSMVKAKNLISELDETKDIEEICVIFENIYKKVLNREKLLIK